MYNHDDVRLRWMTWGIDKDVAVPMEDLFVRALSPLLVLARGRQHTVFCGIGTRCRAFLCLVFIFRRVASFPRHHHHSIKAPQEPGIQTTGKEHVIKSNKSTRIEPGQIM